MEVFNKTQERFTTEEKNLYITILKNKLNIPLDQQLPEGLAGFINEYKDFEELKNASDESNRFINAMEKVENEKFNELSAEEIIVLGLVPKQEAYKLAAEVKSSNNIELNKENKDNVWFQKGLKSIDNVDLSGSIELLKNAFNDKKDSLEAKKEYEISVVQDYNKKVSLLDQFNLPDGQTKDSIIEVLKSSKLESDSMLSGKKAA